MREATREAGGGSGIWQTEVRQKHWKGNDLGRRRLLKTKRQESPAFPTGNIWLKPKEEIKRCVKGIGPTEPYSTCTILQLLQGIWGNIP